MPDELFLRPEQLEILNYTGGRMGISAVPGSGKTFVLSLLATKIIQSGLLQDDQEVLIVTLVNSAVDNLISAYRIRESRQLAAQLGL
jgi:DNA helicase-2/ATP-dependent DNA helicase PcrA